MRIYVCDDEEKILENISEVVKETLPESKIRGFTSGAQLLDALTHDFCDILLLDIDMPDINGMEVARQLSKTGGKMLLIFVTSHDELVYESFLYHPYGFVRKRFMAEELSKLLIDCRDEFVRERKHFTFHADGKDVRVLLADIKYFEADFNYIKIFTNRGQMRFRSTMTALENSMRWQGFIRIHKGFMVNQVHVKMISNEETELNDGTKLPIGKTYVENARRELMRYMR